MKIGKLTHTNSKGQLVIPQEYRNILGISSKVILNIVLQKTGIFIQPIKNVVPKTDEENMYSQVLKQTKGVWSDYLANDNYKKLQQKKRKVEISASKKRKQLW